MTDASIQELQVFARHQLRRLSGPSARGVQTVIGMAPRCGSVGELLTRLEQGKPGEVRDTAIDFVQQFRGPVRDEHVDAVVQFEYVREARLPADTETRAIAGAATVKESLLAELTIEAGIRDAVIRIVGIVNGQDEASGRPLFSWLGRD